MVLNQVTSFANVHCYLPGNQLSYFLKHPFHCGVVKRLCRQMDLGSNAVLPLTECVRWTSYLNYLGLIFFFVS